MTVPTHSEVEAAWHGLPPAMRDRIGIIAVDMVFQAFVHGDAYVAGGRPQDRPTFDEAVIAAASLAADDRLTELHRVVEDAVPDLFGPPGENPAWADDGGTLQRGGGHGAV